MVRTHTLWMKYKTYKKWSKMSRNTIKYNDDKTIMRTHIIFE